MGGAEKRRCYFWGVSSLWEEKRFNASLLMFLDFFEVG